MTSCSTHMNNIIFLSGLYSHAIDATMRPISCYQLAWWLRQHDIESQVIEFTQLLTAEQIVDLIETCIDETTHTIAIGTVFWNTNPKPVVPDQVLNSVRHIKNKYPHLTILGGGPNIRRFSAHTPNFFDMVMSGDSEDQLLNYCQEKKFNARLENKKFNIVECQHRYSKKDLILEHEAVPLELGRGCIFKCKFCSSANIGKLKGTYQRNYDYIFDEIKYNYENFGTTHYMFLDDTINEDMEKIEYLSKIPKRLGVDITWGGYLRVDLIWSHENYNQLFDSGLRNAYFGLESFHPAASKIIGKGWNGTHGKEWIPKLYNDYWNKQVKLEASFIVGLPEEDEQSLNETAKWITELNAGYMFFYGLDLKHNPGNSMLESAFTREYKKYNYIIDENDEWINTKTGFTRKSADALANKLTTQVRQHGPTMGGWTSNHLYNIGMSLEEIRNTTLHDLGYILRRNRDRFVNNYISKFKDLYK